ncbi:permease-like cell division protein FtsX [Halioxenophilus aromaticivorans]|uniref:Cell division protein FtsX n=1 Tax=Halioxenophilus aromaticivorans TaxID=1306992 RepID=A0AAV3TXH9_9ALTE
MAEQKRPTNKRANKRAKPKAPAGKAGPIGEQLPASDRLLAYVKHHQASASEAFTRILRTPGQSLPTCLVIAIALALPALLYLGLANMERQAEQWRAPAQISVFLHKRASNRAIDQFNQQLDRNPQVDSWQLITPEQALLDFQAASGFGDVLADLDDNPLPPVVVITPGDLSVPELSSLRTQLAQDSVVESVLLDLEWVARLQQIMALIERVVSALGSLLALGVVLIVGNVIRLAISSRKDEIVIAKLVGASDGFVRRPFLYTGLWYGLLGGGLAVAMLLLANAWLAGPIARLAALYSTQFELAGLGFGGSLALVLAAGVLGSLGAWLSVSRHLSAIKPT